MKKKRVSSFSPTLEEVHISILSSGNGIKLNALTAFWLSIDIHRIHLHKINVLRGFNYGHQLQHLAAQEFGREQVVLYCAYSLQADLGGTLILVEVLPYEDLEPFGITNGRVHLWERQQRVSAEH